MAHFNECKQGKQNNEQNNGNNANLAYLTKGPIFYRKYSEIMCRGT